MSPNGGQAFVDTPQRVRADLVSGGMTIGAVKVFSNDVIAFLAPGQGSQIPGMLEPWLDLPNARERLSHWSELTGLDLIRLGTTASAEEIKDTAITQPLVVALSLLVFTELTTKAELPADIPVAGHSVGELVAAAMSGVLTADDAVVLAAVRGAEMAAACALEPTGMAAVLGGDESTVLAHLANLDLIPANRNGAGQIVAAGQLPNVDKLLANPPVGARVRALPVAGAFHTDFMSSAASGLRTRAATITANATARPLLSNSDGSVFAPATAGKTVLDRLISQVTSPVRWDACMSTLAKLGVTTVIELPPAGTLTGLVKREIPDISRIALKSPEDFPVVVELMHKAAVS